MFNDVRMASYLLLIVVISVVLWGKANGEIGVTDCGALASPQNGAVTYTSTIQDSVATYSCNAGYQIDGSTTRTCSAVTPRDPDDCNPQPCENGGICTDGLATFTCACADGYAGTTCATNINECASNPCSNGGSCTDLVNSFTCTCASGYTGTMCDTNIDECAFHACKNGATCVDVVAAYTCQCVDGFTGQFCSSNINECSPNPCQNGGACTDGVNTFTCTCIAGYTGNTCGTDINDCSPNPCENGACTDLVNDFSCTCTAGYTGKTCNTDIDDCVSHLCQNGATCVDQVAAYVCQCDAGYTGTYCETSILNDDCSVRPGVCSNLQNAECDGSKCVCSTGYHKTGSSTCSKIDCGTIEPPENGLVNHDEGILYLDRAYFTCDTGYTRSDCGVLIAPTNGDLNDDQGTNYGAIITFSCNTGYTLTGDVTRTCIETGQWSNTNPTCVINACGSLSAPTNGAVDLTDGVLYEDVATFSCNSGFSLTGDVTRICQADTTWSGASPTCSIDDCGPLTNPLNGQVLTVDGTEYQDTAVYSCNQGYKINGVDTRTCMDGDCGPVANITNGLALYSPGTLYGATVIYTCNDGYEVTGDTSRACLADGTWGGSQPSCTILDCDEAPTIPNGFSWLPSGSQVGDYAVYSCNGGYGLVGDPNVLCEPSGFWGVVPECKLVGLQYNELCSVSAQCQTVGATCRDDLSGVDRCLCAIEGEHYDIADDECLKLCSSLGNPTNGQVTNPAILAAGESAVYTCDTGYALSGPGTRTCLSTGVWSGVAPMCVGGCPDPENPSNGAVNTTQGLAAGNIIRYSCDPGYAIQGEEERICEVDSQWSGNTPSCPPKPEPAPEKPREFPEVFDEDKDTGVPPEGFLMAGSIPKIKNSGLSTVKKIYQHEAPRVVPGTKKSILREPPAPSMPKDTLTAGSGKATLGAIRGFLGRGQKKGLPESGEMGATTEMPSNVRLPKIGGGPLPWQSKETVVETPTFKLNGLGGGGDEGFRDGGYNTGNSDDNPNASMNSSIEDVQTIEGPQTTWRANASSSPVQTRRNLMDAAADTFRGRAPIPPVAGSPPTDRNGQAFTDETRRQLRGTICFDNTFMFLYKTSTSRTKMKCYKGNESFDQINFGYKP
ncbi:SVEP1-like protein [Mya arenaria]|uniref:SVEP1-like protein n=1 Tax=Mya arenaria TaxID=6604 RepID=A0ABY7EF23_MYAAR|nr:SVEP1-like protein [Mya arenaria]